MSFLHVNIKIISRYAVLIDAYLDEICIKLINLTFISNLVYTPHSPCTMHGLIEVFYYGSSANGIELE